MNSEEIVTPGKAVISCVHSCVDEHRKAIVSNPPAAKVSINACIEKCITPKPVVDRHCITKCAEEQATCHRAAASAYKETVRECSEAKTKCVSVC